MVKHKYALIYDDWMPHTTYLRRSTDCVLCAEQHFSCTVSAEKMYADVSRLILILISGLSH